MYCLNCGKPLPANSHFCPVCGTRQDELASTSTPPPVSPAVAPLAAPVSTGANTVGGLPEAAPAQPVSTVSTTTATPVAPRSGSVNKALLWGGFAALTLVVAGGAGYMGWQDRQEKEASARQAASAEADRKLAEESQRRVAAEKAAEAAEISAARAAMERHIATLEAQVGARK